MKLIVLLLPAVLAGCASTGPTSATQPANVVAATTSAESALDIAVNAIHIGLDTGTISKPTYWKNIDPVIQTANAAISSSRDAANAAAKANASGDTATALADLNTAQVAENSAMAAVQQLAPYVASTSSKGK